MLERAQRAGVEGRLKAVSAELQARMESGTADEKAAAKQEVQKIQIHNQQIVARAEKAKLKRMTLI